MGEDMHIGTYWVQTSGSWLGACMRTVLLCLSLGMSDHWCNVVDRSCVIHWITALKA